jgi:hypothetical protein
MPWSHTSPMDQKTQFIADYLRDRLSVTERCALYGISRKTAYKWLERYLTHGPQGLKERSRRPRTAPRHTPDHVVAGILDARRRHPSWGTKKLVSILSTRYPRPWPARSTICDILYPSAGGQGCLHARVQRIWPAAAHPHRQWRAICHQHPRPTIPIIRLVGPPGHLAGGHRTWQTVTQWPPRAYAPHPESRHHPTARSQSSRPATTVQSLP